MPFFFKQWGTWLPIDSVEDSRGYNPATINYAAYIDRTFAKVSKKAAGAKLDGREHREFPA